MKPIYTSSYYDVDVYIHALEMEEKSSSSAFNSPLLDTDFPLERRFGLLYHSGPKGWYRVRFKFSFSL